MKQLIQTNHAPQPIGCYSQAIKAGNTVYLSGQIPLDAEGKLITDDFKSQVHQVFKNLAAVAKAASGELNNVVKITVFLIDINNLALVNEVMESYFQKPYPARTSIAVASLPKNVAVEIEATMILG
ncbi:MAG TPA: Rid family detoxifying hydrolase [Gammaproteobacteria bacterium]|nr:Rid family detoxifying hydrolase [Gammaproteobacteria bacterium]